MKTTVQLSRRHVIQGLAALGMSATAGRFAWAAEARAGSGLAVPDAAAIEGQAGAFINPLRLPGASGLYGVMKATDLREVRVVRTEIEILPGKRTPYLAYAAESGGKTFLNPALLARRGDEIRVRMVNQLDEPTIIHWHGLHNDARNDGNGLVVAEPRLTCLHENDRRPCPVCRLREHRPARPAASSSRRTASSAGPSTATATTPTWCRSR